MSWDSGLEFVSCCGKMPSEFNIEFEPKVYAKIDILMDKKDGIEWLAFLLGDIDWENGRAVVSDLYIPDSQSVSSGKVDKIECDESIRNEMIGVIHSHHKMGCFFSNDDWNYLNNNHDISIVVSNKGGSLEFKSVVRYKTACGAYSHVDGNISIKCDIDPDEMNNFIEDIDTKIEEGIIEFPSTSKYQRDVLAYLKDYYNIQNAAEDIYDDVDSHLNISSYDPDDPYYMM